MGGSSEKLTRLRKRSRRCVGCGRDDTKRELLRIVRSPDGTVKVDPTGKAPGRGAYLCKDVECIRLARKRNALSRALKQPIDLMVYSSAEAMALGKTAPEE